MCYIPSLFRRMIFLTYDVVCIYPRGNTKILSGNMQEDKYTTTNDIVTK